MTPDPTPFADLLSARTRDAERVKFDVPADWLQGRTAYGGLIAAIAAQAMLDVAGAEWPPEVRLRSLQTNFVGPVTAGAATVAVQLLREGKSVRQVQASVSSQGQLAATLVGVYGSARATALETLAPTRPVVARSAEAAPSRAFVPGVMPGFLQHFDLGWAEGDPPLSGGKGWATSLYVRLAGDRAGEVDKDVLTVLLADAPPTPAISHFRQPTQASSVTWALELLALDGPVAAEDWWRIDTHTRSARAGYVNHSSTLWMAAGEAAAFGHQLVTVYG